MVLRAIRICIVLIVILVISYKAVSIAAESSGMKQLNKAKSDSKNALQMELSILSRTGHVEDPIYINVTIINNSENPLAILKSNPIVDFYPELYSSDNKTLVNRTVFGDKFIKFPKKEGWGGGSQGAIIIKPKEKTSDRICLSRLYDMSICGEYYVSVSFMHSIKKGQKVDIGVKRLKFRITEGR